ncbi:MAG: hypothetical protein ACK55Z_34050, partial [bacterium]
MAAAPTCLGARPARTSWAPPAKQLHSYAMYLFHLYLFSYLHFYLGSNSTLTPFRRVLDWHQLVIKPIYLVVGALQR